MCVCVCDFTLQGTLGWLLDGELLLTSSGERPGLQLNVLQCRGQALIAKNYLAQNANRIKVWETLIYANFLVFKKRKTKI